MRALVSGALGVGIVVDEPFSIRYADGRSEPCSAQGIRMLTQGCGDLREYVVQDDAALDPLIQRASGIDRLARLARIALDPAETSEVRLEAKEQYQLLLIDDVSLDDIATRLKDFGAEISASTLSSLSRSERRESDAGLDRSYYEILGVSTEADLSAIKSAFRRLSKTLHPDTHPGNEEDFKQVCEAFAVLADPERRAAYDRHGKDVVGGAGSADFEGVLSEIFGEAFDTSNGGSRPGDNRGKDLRYDVEVTLEQAFYGDEREVVLSPDRECEECGNAVAQSQAECPECGYAKRAPNDRTLSVKIPAGVEDGTRIRLAGEGDAGVRGGAPGDLYLFLSIKPHALFERDGADLYCRAVVPVHEAALGGEIEVPSIDGERVRITIPAGSQTGRRFRVKGRGMPYLRGNDRGDLHVELLVEIPVNLTPKQRELLEEFAKDSREKSRPDFVVDSGKPSRQE